MEEDETTGDRPMRLRRELCDIFGSFETFHDRIIRHGMKYGVSKARIPGKTSPTNMTMTNSPNHVHVQHALQSMKYLVEERLPSLPATLPSLSAARRDQQMQHSSVPSTSSNQTADAESKKRKRRDNDNDEADTSDADRRKRSRFDRVDSEKSRIDYDRRNDSLLRDSLNRSNLNRRNEATETTANRRDKDNGTAAISPDSGVHSTENDMGDDNTSIEEILNIMKNIDGPPLSPLPDDCIARIRRKEEMKKRAEEEERRRKEEEEAAAAARKEKEEKRRKEEEEKRKKEDEAEKKRKCEAEKRRKEEESKKKPIKKLMDDDSTSSSASPSTSAANSARGSTSPPPQLSRQDPIPSVYINSEPSTSKKSAGVLSLKLLKSDKFKKLIKLAERNGCLVESIKEERKERKSNDEKSSKEHRKAPTPSPAPSKSSRPSSGMKEKEKEKEKEKSVRPPTSNSTNSLATPKANGSAKNTPSTRPPSSMSTNNEVINSAFANAMNLASTSTTSRSQTVTPRPEAAVRPTVVAAKTNFKCCYSRVRLTAPRRVPFPDIGLENPPSKADFYHGLAKSYKAKADENKDRVPKILDYMIAAVYFTLEAVSKQTKNSSERAYCTQLTRDSAELLRNCIHQAMRPTDDTLVMHFLPRLKVLGQAMLAIMHHHVYTFRSNHVIKWMNILESPEFLGTVQHNTTPQPIAETPCVNNKHLAVATGAPSGAPPGSSAGSTPGKMVANSPARTTNAGTTVANMLETNKEMVMVPAIIFETQRQQIKLMNSLVLAQKYWQEAKSLALYVDSEFLKGIEEVCGKTLTMDASIDCLATIVFTAVESLRAEFNEERVQPIKPSPTKMKPLFDYALKTGYFYTDRVHNTHPSTSSTSSTTTTASVVNSISSGAPPPVVTTASTA
ncbi:unnamed protein product [Caenorhabditis bovis]|uniref:AF4/FMR2 C-terminal homology domain-containing protein n=1 Tax=Caenorhabditis bovis TaxID=2654633 RepID=A0A8S1EQQ4_9PELO|nr:unnamed protein product [Caenorhabditis bovis]